jgi:pimeloyl-ACP methyl ester carboxylesterase
VVGRYLCESGFRGVTLIGHSLGGGVALLVAHRLHELGQPGRLVGLAKTAVRPMLRRYPALSPSYDCRGSGRYDHVIPLWMGKLLADEMQYAQLVVLEWCGHVLPEERP